MKNPFARLVWATFLIVMLVALCGALAKAIRAADVPVLPGLGTSGATAAEVGVTAAVSPGEGGTAAPASIDQSLVTSAATELGMPVSAIAAMKGALTGKSGWLVFAMSWLWVLGSLFKPVMTAIERRVRATQSTADDRVLEAVEHSRAYCVLAWILDWALRIKIGPQFMPGVGVARDLTSADQPLATSGKGGGNANGIAAAIGIIFLVGMFVAAAGCAQRLETGGAYAPGIPVVANGATNMVATAAPDLEFFLVDSTFKLLQGATDAVFETERENRIFLWGISPNIKHTLDTYRPQASAAVKEYAIARKAYMKNPTPAGLSTLRTVSGRMQQISDAVSAALPKGQ